MATSLYDVMLPDVLPYAPDAPQFVVINCIRNAAIEFCNKSRIWQIDLPQIDGTAGVSDYNLATYLPDPTNTTIAGVMYGTYSGWPLVMKSADELARIYRWQDWRAIQGQPAYLHQLEPASVWLVPQPQVTTTQAIQLRVAIKPTRVSTGMDSVIQEQHYELITLGARARLYTMKGQPFFEPQMGAILEQQFITGTNKVRIYVEKSMSRGGQVVERQGIVI